MARRKKYPRLPNSFGSIRYISSGRRHPYAVHPPCKEMDDFGKPIRPKALCYVDDWYVGFAVLTAYHAGTYKQGDEIELRTYRQQSDSRDLDAFCQKIIDNVSASRSSMFISQRGKKTFAEVYTDFYKWKFDDQKDKQLSIKSQQAMTMGFKNAKVLYNRIFEDLRYEDLQACVDNCPLKKESKKKIVTLFKQMYKYADIFELVDKDYSAHVTANTPDDTESGVAFSPEELSILWKHKENNTIEMLLIMCYSGFRISAFKDMEINLEEMYFRGGVKTKAGKKRIVPIHSLIADMVKNRIERYGSNIIGCGYNTFLNRMKRELKEIGIEEHTPHDCRHTFSRLAEKFKIEENDRKRLLGHAFDDITNSVYGHRTVEDLRIEIEKIKIEDVQSKDDESH